MRFRFFYPENAPKRYKVHIKYALEIRGESKYKEEMLKLRQQNGETEYEQYQREVITAVKNIFKQDLDFKEDQEQEEFYEQSENKGI